MVFLILNIKLVSANALWSVEVGDVYTVQHRALQTSSSHLFNYHITVIFITLNVIIVTFRIGPEEVCVRQHITRLPQSVAVFQAGEKKMDSLIHLLKHMLTEHVHFCQRLF